MRRAVSTAYYALFHLLVGEAVSNWKRSDQRAKLARTFDHGQCEKLRSNLPTARLPARSHKLPHTLKSVANAFVRLQELGTWRTMTNPTHGPEHRCARQSSILRERLSRLAGHQDGKDRPRLPPAALDPAPLNLTRNKPHPPAHPHYRAIPVEKPAIRCRPLYFQWLNRRRCTQSGEVSLNRPELRGAL